MRNFAVLLIAGALLSGCVAYETPYYTDRGAPYGARDRDRDGIPNRADRDRDGDGVPNAWDARPNNPRLY